MNSCKVQQCRYPTSHTTSGHKCGLCNQYGHGQVECNNGYLKNKFSGHSNSYFALIKLFFHRLKILFHQRNYDLIILHCELLPMMPAWFERALLRIPYIYDFDDAFFLRYRQGDLQGLQLFLGDKFDSIISRATAVHAGNYFLKEYALQFNPKTLYFPTVVDSQRYSVAPKVSSEFYTVGWIGSPSTSAYLKSLIAPLEELGKNIPIKLVVIGGEVPNINNIHVQCIAWSESEEIDLINTFDVGVMPLPDDEWARGKCAFKLLQYMACGVPVVASDIGANRDVVNLDVGFLASNDADWINALTTLYNEPQTRKRLGANGRLMVEEQYSLSSNLPILIKAINNALNFNT